MFDFTKPSVKVFTHEGKDILVVITANCRKPEDRFLRKGDENGPTGPCMNEYESFMQDTSGACAARIAPNTRWVQELMPAEAGDVFSWKAEYVVAISVEIATNCGAEGATGVFWHEIGHIVSGHQEEGAAQPSSLEEYVEKESEADAYAASKVGKECMKNALLKTVGAMVFTKTGMQLSAFMDSGIPMASALRARLLALS